jgi:hypothetical protein
MSVVFLLKSYQTRVTSGFRRAEDEICDLLGYYLAYTVETLLSGLMTGCRWPDNKKSRIIEDDPNTPGSSLGVIAIPPKHPGRQSEHLGWIFTTLS